MTTIRKMLYAAAAVCAVFAFAATSARADTINFDDTSGAIANNRYQLQGVLLSTNAPATLTIITLIPVVPTNTPPNALCGLVTGGARGSSCSGQIIVDFVMPGTNTPGVVDSVSFFVTDAANDANRMGVYLAYIVDANGSILGFQSGNLENEQISFSVAGIRRLVFTPSIDDELIDTLTFGTITPASNTTAVPEPTTLLLLGTGLTGIAAKVRRRKAQTGERV